MDDITKLEETLVNYVAGNDEAEFALARLVATAKTAQREAFKRSQYEERIHRWVGVVFHMLNEHGRTLFRKRLDPEEHAVFDAAHQASIEASRDSDD